MNTEQTEQVATEWHFGQEMVNSGRLKEYTRSSLSDCGPYFRFPDGFGRWERWALENKPGFSRLDCSRRIAIFNGSSSLRAELAALENESGVASV
jgi:hypothetical protein